MALGFYFTNGNFPQDRYEEALRQLEAAGAGAPKGRSYHVALEKDREIIVFDIWEPQEFDGRDGRVGVGVGLAQRS